MNRKLLIAGGGVIAAGLLIAVLRPEGPADQSQTAAAVDPAPGAAMVTVSLPENLSAQAQLGKRAFEAKCAVCPGQNAAGQNGTAPPLVHRIYEPGHHADYAFQMAAKNGVQAHHWTFGNMPPIQGLTPSDVSNIVAYVRALQQANGIN